MSPFSTPPTCEVPHFAPLRVRGGRWRARRAGRYRRRAVAAGLAVTAAVLVAAGPSGAGSSGAGSSGAGSSGAGSGSSESASGRERVRRSVVMVSAPVRIADAAAVRLLRPGDRVDVVAAGAGAGAGDGQGSGRQGGRVVAAGARVSSVPESPESAGDAVAEGGALVVLSVPRATAARLAGAGATSRLAVTLW
ncbi:MULTISPECIES: RcpC/CpaB family pilus assembly protein [unclassified Streptomyces]|uniref:RcpC/CpaB family pilus assembly protein n=1 Tax=unclassified Streptomyces TaxID=2593676 RepID=UPI002DDADE20|nr:RcpC/CpaB family pilus assembly protein [Streptomyces sp. NBC_01445]WSE06683.1 RcpC/CpaB family pilus assembly protein [Streptomyces sp. NBC_01445]